MLNLITSWLISALLLINTYPSALEPIAVEGFVVEAKTHQPLPDVYVYIIKGEEEALTDKNGWFKIKTWRSLPLSLTVQQGEKVIKVNVSSVSKKLTIKF